MEAESSTSPVGGEKSDDISSMKISSSDWNIVKPKPSKGKEKQTVVKKVPSTQDATNDDGDDLPGDFFDDFLKEDFMAGLDVVDEDEEADEKGVSENAEEEVAQVPVKSGLGTKPNKKQKQKMFTNDTSKQSHQKKASKPPSKDSASKGPIKPKIRNEDNKSEPFLSDTRRDPSKTKRDIERDKERCVKDKEKKLITEKLALVETGLVPPGMEMEIDVEEIRRQKNEIEQIKEKVEKMQRTVSRSPRRRSPLFRRSLSLNRSSPKRKRSPVESRRPSRRSSTKKSPKRSPRISPRRSPRKSPRRSPRKSPRRSPYRKRSPLKKISPPMRRVLSSDIARAERLSLSPKQDKRDDRRSSPRRGNSRDRKSLGSKISPLRRRRSPVKRRSRSRSRSSSPYFRGGRRYSPSPIRRRRSSSREQERRRRRSRTRSPKRSRKEEKKSFLQEIVEKLNDTSGRHMQLAVPPGSHLYRVGPGVSTAMPPQPMPPHQQIIPAPQVVPVPIQPSPVMQPYIPPAPVNVPAVVPGPVPAPVPPPAQVRPALLPNPTQNYDLNFFIGDGSPQMNNLRSQTSQNSGTAKTSQNPGAVPNSKDDISKLFQDKKISLSQFLAISAKPEASSSNPAELREKVKVITRCQEAIKYLSRAENKFSGRLYIQKTQAVPNPDKNSSPLKRMTQVKIPFTELPTKAESTNTFSGCIDRLLKHLGLQSEAIEIDDKEDRASSPPPPPPPSITKAAPVQQSARSNCPDCEKRRRKTFKNSGTQYSDDHMSYSVSTQVSEDDLNPNRIPKNQSIASLTPAQLLGKAKFGSGSKMDMDEFDILPQRSEGFMRGPGGRSREGYGGGGGRNNLESDYRYRF
ncbi:unnamed protein product [Callosobruchus maculatus]|uniref:Uncharacterized protein n=1 Tax=Callosobruchus maculatus TaxID=64391 RepID=A0A653BXP7_CALMS|nr:unnamed protein product [Callosobruchus maculatus]